MLRNRQSVLQRNQPTIYPLPIDPRHRLRFVLNYLILFKLPWNYSSFQLRFQLKL